MIDIEGNRSILGSAAEFVAGTSSFVVVQSGIEAARGVLYADAGHTALATLIFAGSVALTYVSMREIPSEYQAPSDEF